MKNKIIFVTAFLGLAIIVFPQVSIGQLKIEDITQGDSKIASFYNKEVVLVDNSKLRLSVTPTEYLNSEDCYKYKIAWNYKTTDIVVGSIGINDSVWRPKAWTEFSATTGCLFAPNKAYRIVFYAGENGTGGKLYAGSFITPKVFFNTVVQDDISSETSESATAPDLESSGDTGLSAEEGTGQQSETVEEEVVIPPAEGYSEYDPSTDPIPDPNSDSSEYDSENTQDYPYTNGY